MIKRIPFVDWRPDQGGFSPGEGVLSGGAVLRALPSPNGYSEPPDWSTNIGAGSMGTSKPCGGKAANLSGTKYFFFGSQTNIYRISATATVTDVSASGGYSLTAPESGGRWEFIQWDSDMYAFSGEADTQSMGVSATAFTVLEGATSSTAIPRARTAAISRNFVIAGNTYDATDATVGNRVRWSALGDPTDWTVSAVTQADFEDLKGGGDVLRIFGGEYAVVFTERSVWRMSYIGSPLIWQFDEVQPSLRLLSANAAAQKGDVIFAAMEEGFYMIRNGSDAVPIGHGRVDDFFLGEVQANHVKDITCSVDPEFERVYWSYINSVSTNINFLLVYDYGLNKWGLNSIEGGNLGEGPALPVNFDNDHYGLQLAFMNRPSGNAAVTLQDNVDGAGGFVTTSKLELVPGRNAMVKSVIVGMEKQGNFVNQPLDLQVKVLGYDTPYRTDFLEGVTDDQAATTLPNLRHSVRRNGKYHKFEISFSTPSGGGSDFDKRNPTQIKFIDVEYVPTHWR